MVFGYCCATLRCRIIVQLFDHHLSIGLFAPEWAIAATFSWGCDLAWLTIRSAVNVFAITTDTMQRETISTLRLTHGVALALSLKYWWIKFVIVKICPKQCGHRCLLNVKGFWLNHIVLNLLTSLTFLSRKSNKVVEGELFSGSDSLK